MHIYIAHFRWGIPSLVKADVVKETPKTFLIDRGSVERILGKWAYIPARIHKENYFCSGSKADALGWLIPMMQNYVIATEKKLSAAQERLENLQEILETMSQ
jgi:hypothetical protein